MAGKTQVYEQGETPLVYPPLWQQGGTPPCISPNQRFVRERCGGDHLALNAASRWWVPPIALQQLAFRLERGQKLLCLRHPGGGQVTDLGIIGEDLADDLAPPLVVLFVEWLPVVI